MLARVAVQGKGGGSVAHKPEARVRDDRIGVGVRGAVISNTPVILRSYVVVGRRCGARCHWCMRTRARSGLRQVNVLCCRAGGASSACGPQRQRQHCSRAQLREQAQPSPHGVRWRDPRRQPCHTTPCGRSTLLIRMYVSTRRRHHQHKLWSVEPSPEPSLVQAETRPRASQGRWKNVDHGPRACLATVVPSVAIERPAAPR
ncbi:hypothetical protein BC834DRAFT_861625 [Gloeopeniophorella convolvens]|nr:hypothetical protein BC834DRAFT_861625 [Gloeopeniophorella convolvens]